jgi:hypothetical protein
MQSGPPLGAQRKQKGWGRVQYGPIYPIYEEKWTDSFKAYPREKSDEYHTTIDSISCRRRKASVKQKSREGKCL